MWNAVAVLTCARSSRIAASRAASGGPQFSPAIRLPSLPERGLAGARRLPCCERSGFRHPEGTRSEPDLNRQDAKTARRTGERVGSCPFASLTGDAFVGAPSLVALAVS